MNTKVAIIGLGYVGRAIKRIFPEALVYDPFLEDAPNDANLATKDQVNRECKLAIICVPTPMDEGDGEFHRVDTSTVDESVEWLETPLILIKSTVPPGTTDRLESQTHKSVCFSPEYVGESHYHVTEWQYMSTRDPRTHQFVIIGGRPGIRDEVANVFVERLGPEKFYYLVEAKEAEVIKYMENCWGAMKVVFANEFHELCEKLGISYIRVREGWALDNRVERMHTAVFVNDRGFGGKCYPKDLNGIVQAATDAGVELDLVKAVLRRNARMRLRAGFEPE